MMGESTALQRSRTVTSAPAVPIAILYRKTVVTSVRQHVWRLATTSQHTSDCHMITREWRYHAYLIDVQQLFMTILTNNLHKFLTYSHGNSVCGSSQIVGSTIAHDIIDHRLVCAHVRRERVRVCRVPVAYEYLTHL
jgi:hypothetical protein